MGSNTGDVNRNSFNESKKFIEVKHVQGPNPRPLVVEDINEQNSILQTLVRRLAQVSLGDGFEEDAFKIIPNTSNQNDFRIVGGDNSADGAKRGYLKGHQLSKFQTSNFKSTTVSDIHSKSTDLTSTVLTDTAANYTTNELVGRYLYPNTSLNQGFLITANTATTITTAGNHLGIASPGDRYRIDMSTPTGTRTDSVIIDVYVDEIDSDEDVSLKHQIAIASGFSSIEGAIRKKLETKIWVKENSDADPSSTFTDTDGNIHYQARIAKITRTSGTATITSSHITDLRNVNFSQRNENFNYVIIQSGLVVSGTTTLSGTNVFSGTTQIIDGSGSLVQLDNGCLTFSGTCLNFIAGTQTYNASPSGKRNIFGNNTFASGSSSGPLIELLASGTSQKIFRAKNQTGNSELMWIDSNGTINASGSSVYFKDVVLRPRTNNQSVFKILEAGAATGTSPSFQILENGRIYHDVPRIGADPYYHAVIKSVATNTVPSWYIEGSVDTSLAFNQFENKSKSNISVPCLMLNSYSSGTDSFGLFNVYTREQKGGIFGGIPTFQVNNDGFTEIQSLPSEEAGLKVKNSAGEEKVLIHSSGSMQLLSPAYNTSALKIRHPSGTIAFSVVGHGRVTINDDGTSSPGILIRSNAGSNKIRLNVNGLLLPTAQITQNPTTPTTLNVLSNDGVDLDYDEDNDSSGDFKIRAGSTLVATFGTQGNPHLQLERRLILANQSGTDTHIYHDGDDFKAHNLGDSNPFIQYGSGNLKLIPNNRITLRDNYTCGQAQISSGSRSVSVTPSGFSAASNELIVNATPYTLIDASSLAGNQIYIRKNLVNSTFLIEFAENVAQTVNIDWMCFGKE